MSHFEVREIAILNSKAEKGLPSRVGERLVILEKIKSENYDYKVQFDDLTVAKVKESELYKLTDDIKWKMDYIITNNKVIHRTAGVVRIIKCDYIHEQAEVEYKSGVTEVVNFNNLIGDGNNFEKEEKQLGYFEELGLSIGKLVDEKQKAYGDSVTKCYEIMKVLLNDYHNEKDHTYTIPESLLPQMLLDIRKIDKLNRRFSNPDGDLMGENPFQDDVGYSMLGVRMVENLNINDK